MRGWKINKLTKWRNRQSLLYQWDEMNNGYIRCLFKKRAVDSDLQWGSNESRGIHLIIA